MTTGTLPTIAGLRNVAELSKLMDRVLQRPAGLPGMATFCGPSGYGKSFAAIYVANKHRAYHVQCKSVWTRRSLCETILKEMGIRPQGTVPTMLDQIGEQLTASQRPLIIDEADHLIPRTTHGVGGLIEVVRDIYESCQGSIVLIGEDGLPKKLLNWERIHGRMVDIVQAVPANLADAQKCVPIYCRGVAVADDLLEKILEASNGSVRRIAVNLDRVRERAQKLALKSVDLAAWESSGGGEFFTGRAPEPRYHLIAAQEAGSASRLRVVKTGAN